MHLSFPSANNVMRAISDWKVVRGIKLMHFTTSMIKFPLLLMETVSVWPPRGLPVSYKRLEHVVGAEGCG